MSNKEEEGLYGKRSGLEAFRMSTNARKATILHRQSPTAAAVKSGLEPNLQTKIKLSQAADTFYKLVYVCLWDILA